MSLELESISSLFFVFLNIMPKVWFPFLNISVWSTLVKASKHLLPNGNTVVLGAWGSTVWSALQTSRAECFGSLGLHRQMQQCGQQGCFRDQWMYRHLQMDRTSRNWLWLIGNNDSNSSLSANNRVCDFCFLHELMQNLIQLANLKIACDFLGCQRVRCCVCQ